MQKWSSRQRVCLKKRARLKSRSRTRIQRSLLVEGDAMYLKAFEDDTIPDAKTIKIFRSATKTRKKTKNEREKSGTLY